MEKEIHKRELNDEQTAQVIGGIGSAGKVEIGGKSPEESLNPPFKTTVRIPTEYPLDYD